MTFERILPQKSKWLGDSILFYFISANKSISKKYDATSLENISKPACFNVTIVLSGTKEEEASMRTLTWDILFREVFNPNGTCLHERHVPQSIFLQMKRFSEKLYQIYPHIIDFPKYWPFNAIE